MHASISAGICASISSEMRCASAASKLSLDENELVLVCCTQMRVALLVLPAMVVWGVIACIVLLCHAGQCVYVCGASSTVCSFLACSTTPRIRTRSCGFSSTARPLSRSPIPATWGRTVTSPTCSSTASRLGCSRARPRQPRRRHLPMKLAFPLRRRPAAPPPRAPPPAG